MQLQGRQFKVYNLRTVLKFLLIFHRHASTRAALIQQLVHGMDKFTPRIKFCVLQALHFLRVENDLALPPLAWHCLSELQELRLPCHPDKLYAVLQSSRGVPSLIQTWLHDEGHLDDVVELCRDVLLATELFEPELWIQLMRHLFANRQRDAAWLTLSILCRLPIFTKICHSVVCCDIIDCTYQHFNSFAEMVQLIMVDGEDLNYIISSRKPSNTIYLTSNFSDHGHGGHWRSSFSPEDAILSIRRVSAIFSSLSSKSICFTSIDALHRRGQFKTMWKLCVSQLLNTLLSSSSLEDEGRLFLCEIALQCLATMVSNDIALGSAVYYSKAVVISFLNDVLTMLHDSLLKLDSSAHNVCRTLYTFMVSVLNAFDDDVVSFALNNIPFKSLKWLLDTTVRFLVDNDIGSQLSAPGLSRIFIKWYFSCYASVFYQILTVILVFSTQNAQFASSTGKAFASLSEFDKYILGQATGDI